MAFVDSLKRTAGIAAQGVRWASDRIPWVGKNARMTALVATISGALLGARDLRNDGVWGALKWGLLSGGSMWAAEELVDWDPARDKPGWEWAVNHASKGLKAASRIIPVGSDYVRATTLLGVAVGATKGLFIHSDEHRERNEHRWVSIAREAFLLGLPRFADAFIADGILQAAHWADQNPKAPAPDPTVVAEPEPDPIAS
jgi:hypothetical protein